jgi:hypothetical protein
MKMAPEIIEKFKNLTLKSLMFSLRAGSCKRLDPDPEPGFQESGCTKLIQIRTKK